MPQEPGQLTPDELAALNLQAPETNEPSLEEDELLSLFGDSGAADQPGGQRMFSDKYDKGYLPGVDRDKLRAGNQPWTEQFGRGLGRAALNVIPSIIGNAASILDFEDYMNQDQEVGNAVTRAMEELKQETNESMPIYQEKPGTPLQMGDPGWWFENGSQVLESAAAFVITGYGLGAGLTKGAQAMRWLSSLGKTTKLSSTVQGATTLLNTVGLNQAEGMTTAIGVYDKMLEKGKEQGFTDEVAQQKAADAAAYSININRANILLNLTSAGALMKSPATTRALIKRMGTAQAMGLEGAQEYAEEVVNLYAERMGMAAGEDLLEGETINQEFSLSDLAELATTPEGIEAGVLGAFGGIAQTGGTRLIHKALGRDKNIKERQLAQKDYLKEIETVLQENKVPNLLGTIKATADISGKVQARMQLLQQDELTEDDKIKINDLENEILKDQAKYAFDLGTTESLVDLYNKVENMTPEQAAQKGYTAEQLDEKSPTYYKKRAQEVKDNILKLENIYKDSQKYENSNTIFNAKSKLFFSEKEVQAVTAQKQLKQLELQKRIDSMGQYPSNVKENFDIDALSFKELNEEEKVKQLKEAAYIRKNFDKEVPLRFVSNDTLSGKDVEVASVFGEQLEGEITAKKAQSLIKKKYKLYEQLNKCLRNAHI